MSSLVKRYTEAGSLGTGRFSHPGPLRKLVGRPCLLGETRRVCVRVWYVDHLHSLPGPRQQGPGLCIFSGVLSDSESPCGANRQFELSASSTLSTCPSSFTEDPPPAPAPGFSQRSCRPLCGSPCVPLGAPLGRCSPGRGALLAPE